MRLEVDSITLVGAERRFSFQPGLNVIAGPIATGKTTLIRCVRGLLAGNLDKFSREAKLSIESLAGQLVIGDTEYNVVRPFVTTGTARVEVAGDNVTERFPVSQKSSNQETTYRDWLLDRLGLPKVKVPRAPTKPESELSPVTINDYMMYCQLQQGEIDNSVFGHTVPGKNNKRIAVFNIVYGRYDVELESLRDELREVTSELRRWRNWSKTVDEFLAGTHLENRATIERGIRETEAAIAEFETRAVHLADRASEQIGTTELRERLRQLDAQRAELRSQAELETRSMEQMGRLVAQLQTQSARLTKAIVAEDYLLDFDFMMCPRCGSATNSTRAEDGECYLCLQHPQVQNIGREELVKEQDRLESQITETQELLRGHQERVRYLQDALDLQKDSQTAVARELDFRSQAFVSRRADIIADIAQKRTELQERLKRLRDYLSLFERRGEITRKIAELEARESELEAIIENVSGSNVDFEERISYLDEQFRVALTRFEPPQFPNAESRRLDNSTYIDRTTYRPVVQGRPFDQLQSPGFLVLVNVAHALAHQITAIERGLYLPNILLIDGVSNNLGKEGLDDIRVDAVYDYLIEVAEKYQDRLQIIVADNTVPERAREYIRIRFTEDERLIPTHLLGG